MHELSNCFKGTVVLGRVKVSSVGGCIFEEVFIIYLLKICHVAIFNSL